jgi:hypothetical protein
MKETWTILTEKVHNIADGNQPSHSEKTQDLQEKSQTMHKLGWKKRKHAG